jgi:hypothetical protein
MNSPILPPRPFSATEYEAMMQWLANEYRNSTADTRPVITLATCDYRVIAVNDPQRQAAQ